MKRMFSLILGVMFIAVGVSAASAATILHWTDGDNHPSQAVTQAATLATALGGSTSAGFSGTSDPAWSTALATANIIIIPQTSSTSALSATTRANIATWVNAGGRLIVQHTTENIDLLNSVLGSSIAYVYGGYGTGTPLIPRTAAAVGTTFASAPASLPMLDDHGGIVASSLPTGALSIYELGGTTHVMIRQVGSGAVAFFSWDWCCGDTPAMRAQWDSALAAAATFSGSFAVISTEIPTLSEWGLIIMSAMLGLTALIAMRRKHAG
jgi:hypothetical protein